MDWIFSGIYGQRPKYNIFWYPCYILPVELWQTSY